MRPVAAGPPGDEAGLARGNLIVAIDDQDLARGTNDDYAGRFQRDGVSVKVKAEMAGSHYDRTLTLKSPI